MPTTRSDLYRKLNIATGQTIGPILEAASEIEEEQIWREDLFNSPHGEHWHTSFHASNFPGDDDKACGRKAMYELMNIPADKPVDMGGRMVMAAGKNLEEEIVWRLHRSGILLSDPPDSPYQMGFEDATHWLTGSPDAIINLPKKNRPHVIEIKGKDGSIVEEMRQGKRSFDKAHRNQTLTYIGLTVENQENLWPELNKCKDGTLLYVSRNRPATTFEFRFSYDKDFMDQGYDQLQNWKESYINEELPERNDEWFWSKPEYPCKYCPFKRYCKQDVQEGITKLSESNAITHARNVYSEYNYDKTKEEVLDRWN